MAHCPLERRASCADYFGNVLYDRRPVAAVAAVGALATAGFCFVTTENLPVGLLPIIGSSLHVSTSAVGLLVTAYAFVVVGVSAPLTHLTQRVPRRLLVSSLLATFIVGSLAAAAAQNYWWLLGARVLTATAQALFWAVSAVTAVGLFPPRLRSKVVTGVMCGGSVAVVLGVPAGTWIGQQGGWRLPFVVLGTMAGASLAAVAFLLPTLDPADSHAAVGDQPSRRRFYLLVVATVLVVGGFTTLYTYISPFLTKVSGLPAHDVAPVLLVGGLASAIGVTSTGMLFDRFSRTLTVCPVVLIAAGLLGMWALQHTVVAAVIMAGLANLGLGCFVVSNQSRVLIVAPGSSDVASAWASASFNVGIGGGALVGSVVVAALSTSQTALVGGLLSGAALVVVLIDQVAHPGPLRAQDTPLAPAWAGDGPGR